MDTNSTMDFEDLNLPCVICAKLFSQDESLKSQEGLTLALCVKLYKLYYSEMVSVNGRMYPSQPVFDFTRECLPFCQSCRRDLLHGIKLCEQIQSIETQLESSMSKLRQRALESPKNGFEFWKDHKLGVLRRQMLKSSKSTFEETLGDVHLNADLIDNVLGSAAVNHPESDSMKVFIARRSVNGTSEGSSEERRNATPLSAKSNFNRTPNLTLVNPVNKPWTSAKIINRNHILATSGANSTKTSQAQHARIANSKELVEPPIEDSNTQGRMNGHEYRSYSSGEEDDRKMMLCSDVVEAVLEESESEVFLSPPKRIRKPTHKVQMRRRQMKTKSSLSNLKTFQHKAKRIRHKVNYGNRPKPVTCEQCGKNFKTNAGLNGHLWVHNRQYCGLCRQYFPTKADIAEHRATVHPADAEYACKICEKIYTNRDALLHHLRQHNDVETYGCSDPSCSKMFKTRLEVKAHMNMFHSPEGLSKGPSTFFLNSDLTEQEQFYQEDVEINGEEEKDIDETSFGHSGHIQQRVGGFSLSNYPHLTFSEGEEDESVDPRAIVSSGVTVSISPVRDPEHDYNEQEEFLRRAAGFGKQNQNSSLKRILNTNVRQPFHNTQGYQQLHLQRKAVRRVSSQQGMLECDECGKKCASKIQLRCHKRNHPKSVIECHICCRRFNRLDNLKVHMKSHTNNFVQYKCQLCSKIFATAQFLDAHLQTHYAGVGLTIKAEPKETVTLFKCGICRKTFQSKTALEIHSRLHSPINNNKRKNGVYRCEYCDKPFTYASNRRRHIVHFHVQRNRQTI